MLTGCGPTRGLEAARKRKPLIVALVKSPTLTPARLAASSPNTRRSTAPRTAAGNRRIVVKALKCGRYLKGIRENLVRVGRDVELFDWICAQVERCFEPLALPERIEAERLARQCRRVKSGDGRWELEVGNQRIQMGVEPRCVDSSRSLLLTALFRVKTK